MPMQKPGRPKLPDGSTTGPQLNAMLQARGQLTKCVDGFDTLLYNAHDHARAERGLDQLVLDTIRALRRFYVVRTGIDADVP
jgi:hypothetical protein